MDDDYAIEDYDEFEEYEYTQPKFGRDIHSGSGRSFPPLMESFNALSATPAYRPRSSSTPQPRQLTQTTTSVGNRTDANATIVPQRRWYGPGSSQNMTTSSGYGPTSAFPNMHLDQPSPPDSKHDVKIKGVKHKRGYQACDQCRQRKTGCQLGSMQT